MDIQWFPGHMHKARKEIKKMMSDVDVVIEILDARMPLSSENPLVHSLASGKPIIRLLNKRDLADDQITDKWLKYFESENTAKVLATQCDDKKTRNILIQQCKSMATKKATVQDPIRLMIMGIPNVGKSSIINLLRQKKIAKVGNEPAITKGQQKISLGDGIYLYDTPGILWPKIEPPVFSFRLAACGSIKDTAMAYEDAAFFLAEQLLERYPKNLKKRYKLDELPDSALQLVLDIGAKRGCMRTGAKIDIHKASEILVKEFRDGLLGNISLEDPDFDIPEEVEVD